MVRAYNNYVSSKGYAGNRPLSFYKDGVESEKSQMPQQLDEYVTLFDINMKDNILCYDYYIDDFLLDESYLELTKQQLLEAFKYSSSEMREDMKTYKIKIHYRYFSKESKKFLKEVVIDLAKEL